MGDLSKMKIYLMRIFIVFVLVNLGIFSINITASTDDEYTTQSTISTVDVDWWPMYQHDVANTGFSPGPFPDSLTLLYNHTYKSLINQTYASFQASSIIADGKIVIAGGGGTLETDIIALDENTGTVIWKTDLPLNYSSTWFAQTNTPVITNGKIFTCYGSIFCFPPQSRIFALDEDTGEILWQKRLFITAAYPSLTISNNTVIVGGHFTSLIPISRLYALDGDTGEVIWAQTMHGYFESTPAIANDTVCATTSARTPMTLTVGISPVLSGRARVYAFNIADGNKLWDTRVKGLAILASPSISQDVVFVPSTSDITFFGKRRITALNLDTGEEIWHHEIKKIALFSMWPTSISAPSIAYGKLFINDASGTLMALEETTGELLWESDIIEEIEGASICAAVPPVIADHKVITTSIEFDNYLRKVVICMFNASTGERIWRYDFDGINVTFMCPFAIANGKLIVNTVSSIYVFN
jgi:outer membrane protein assembly factor BamB